MGTLDTSVNMRGKIQISQLNSKEHGDFCTMAIMAIFTYAKDFQRPSRGVVAPLDCHPKLVDVNEHASRDLEDHKRRRGIPEGEYPKLDLFLQSLIGFDGGLFLGDIKVIKKLRYALVGVQLGEFIVDEGGHLLLCCIGVCNIKGDKLDHVLTNDSSMGWPAGLAVVTNLL